MKAIHRTNNYNEGYNIVEVLKNPISKTNKLAEIRNDDGSINWTGGILCEVHQHTLDVLDTMKPEQQWEWLKSIKAPDVYVYDHLKSDL